MILNFSIGFFCLLLFCDSLPTSETRPTDVIENEAVPGKGEKLEAEIERIGMDMNPEIVIAHETQENVELKINDEFDLKSNLENLTIERSMTSTTTEKPEVAVVKEEVTDQEEFEEPEQEQSEMKINDEFDLKRNLENLDGNKIETSTTTATTTTVEPVVTTLEPRVDQNEWKEKEQDGTQQDPMLNMNDEEQHSKEKLEMDTSPTTTTTVIPFVTTQEPTSNIAELDNDEKEAEEVPLRNPNAIVFGKFGDYRHRVLGDAEPPEEVSQIPTTRPSPESATAEPELYFKPATVSDKVRASEAYNFKHQDSPKKENLVPGAPEPKKEEEVVEEERSKDTLRRRMEIIEDEEDEEVKETKTDDDWISLIHLLLFLSPYDEDEITWFKIVLEAVKCSLRNCPTNHSHWHHRVVDLPRITRHRRQDSEFSPEDPPKTTPKPCACSNLEGYFEKMYESMTAKNGTPSA